VRLCAWLIALIIVSLNVKLVIQEIQSWIESAGDQAWMIYLFVIPLCLATGGLLLYITFKPSLDRRRAEQFAKSPHGTATDLSSLEKPVYQRITISIDFSHMDALAISSALAQGGKYATYQLVHVVETAGALWYGSEISDRESADDQLALEKYADQLAAQGYAVQTQSGFGNPKRIIPEIIKGFDSDLLVMGAHGHKWVKDLVLGATVDTVRHRVNIPVLIVRDKHSHG
ncbi:MAG: universal stress protein, partial [Flammeovirgaceae bacterium]